MSSITDNATGDFTVNFTTAMPDANYCVSTTTGRGSTSTNARCINIGDSPPNTSGVRVIVRLTSDAAYNDNYIMVAIIR